jgi:iron complex transport system ATP-binding protein
MLSGNIVVDGRPLSDFSDQELSHTIGIVLTGKPDVQNMTVEDIVALGRSPYTGFWGTLDDDDKAVVEESMSLVGITHLRSRMIQTLSDGERQKMMIAKALAQQTPVIFLDEPTAFLDYPSKVEMLQLLRRLSHDTDKIIFLSTHDMELALQIADELWLMAPDGISVGTPAELAANGRLSAFINRPGITFNPQTLTIKIV